MIPRFVAAAAVAIVAVAVVGCSDDEAPIASYCLRLDELIRLDVELGQIAVDDTEASERGLRSFAVAVSNAAEQAPGTVAEDLEVVESWVDALVGAYGELSGDPLADAVRFEAAVDGLADPSDALARVRSHARNECGFDLDEAP